MLVFGLGDGFRNQEIMTFGVLGLENNESGFYCTDLKQKKWIKLLKVLSKHNSPIHGRKIAIIIAIFFRMIFRWFPCTGPPLGGHEWSGQRGQDRWLQKTISGPRDFWYFPRTPDMMHIEIVRGLGKLHDVCLYQAQSKTYLGAPWRY